MGVYVDVHISKDDAAIGGASRWVSAKQWLELTIESLPSQGKQQQQQQPTYAPTCSSNAVYNAYPTKAPPPYDFEQTYAIKADIRIHGIVTVGDSMRSRMQSETEHRIETYVDRSMRLDQRSNMRFDQLY
jgi:hypothetical protein